MFILHQILQHILVLVNIQADQLGQAMYTVNDMDIGSNYNAVFFK